MRLFLAPIIMLQLSSHLYAIESDENRHSFAPLQQGALSAHRYFNNRGFPNVGVGYRTKPNCKENCDYPVIENQSGEVLVRYSYNDKLQTIAKGRYTHIAYLQYQRSYPCGDKTCYQTFFIDNRGRKSPRRPTPYGMLSALVSKDKKIYSLTRKGIYINASFVLPLEHTLSLGIIRNNPEGDIAAAGIDTSGQLYSTNTKVWKASKIRLQEHGDRQGILSIYPKNKDESYIAIYNYIRAENKGLMGVHTTYSTSEEASGWLYNARDKNVGFDPSIVVHNNKVYVSATDSSDSKEVVMVIDEDQFDTIADADNLPQHIIGYEKEREFTFLLGSRLAYNGWHAATYVDANDMDYADACYELDDSIYTALYFSGRIYNINLGLSYLQNWAEKRGDGAKVASKVFNMFLDFDSLFSKSSSLRIEVEQAKLNGTVHYERNDNTGIITGPSVVNTTFETTYANYSAKVMMERGAFVGISYIEYNAPAAVGFSNSNKDIEYVTFDNNVNYQNYILYIGYDELSYAKRYETDLSRFYIEGNGGIGFNLYELSDLTRQEVEQSTSKNINTTWSMVLQAELNLGYIWQRRFNNIHGFGYAITTGFKTHGAWQRSGQSKENDSNIEENTLQLETERYDLWYGPYVSFNVLF